MSEHFTFVEFFTKLNNLNKFRKPAGGATWFFLQWNQIP